MYREYVPPESVEYLQVLKVSEQVVHGLYEQRKATEQGYFSDKELFENLEYDNPELNYAIEHMVEAGDLEGRDAELFWMGAAVTYAAITYQASILDTQMPELQEYVTAGVTYDFYTKQEDGTATAYISESIIMMSQLNPQLIEGWHEYLDSADPEHTEEDKIIFAVGGLMVHEFLVQQLNADQLLDTSLNSVN